MANEGKPTRSAGWLLNFISFVAVICIGISLLLSKVGLNGDVSEALSTIAQVISYLVLVIISCFYIAKKRSITLWIIWGVSVALIIISFIIGA